MTLHSSAGSSFRFSERERLISGGGEELAAIPKPALSFFSFPFPFNSRPRFCNLPAGLLAALIVVEESSPGKPAQHVIHTCLVTRVEFPTRFPDATVVR